MSQRQARATRRRTKFSPVMLGLMVIFLCAASITAYLTFAAIRELTSARAQTQDLPELALTEVAGGLPQVNFDITGPLQNENGPTPQPWDGTGRVTVLLMGLDYRDWEGDGPSRTDTMMLFTMDPASRTAGMLSIPRDLWVNIPGFDYGKINTAYYLGELYDLEGGGPGLAITTVEQLIGVPINYYAQVDFSAFEGFINEIGGVEVDVPFELSVDPIGPGNTVILPEGMQTLDGPTALAYARNRDTFGGDFDRAARQQQVVMAIRDRILSVDMLTTLITRAPVLYNQLAFGIHTNMSIEEAIRLAWVVPQIPEENITRRVIGVDQVTMTYSPDGLDILVPDTDAVRTLRDEVFTTTGAISPAATVVVGNPTELRQAEAATISILNATSTPGLAARTSDFLRENDINVTITGNAQELSDSTVIIDYTGKPYTLQYLVELMNIQSSSIYSRYDPNSDVDITILLGADWADSNPMP